MTGDEVRGARFREKLRGYAPNEVDEALERIAAALDAGQPLGGAELARIEQRGSLPRLPPRRRGRPAAADRRRRRLTLR